MKRKILSGIMLTLLLISMLTLAFNIQPVKAPLVSGVSIPLKVLHVSAFYYNEVQQVINIAGASSLFEVTQVRLYDFNNGNPSDLSAYNTIVFGISDRFEGPYASYSPYVGTIGRISELESYVQQGGGIVWTHDSLEFGNDYGQYKVFEKQVNSELEETHEVEGGYYKCYRLKVGDMTLEVRGPVCANVRGIEVE